MFEMHLGKTNLAGLSLAGSLLLAATARADVTQYAVGRIVSYTQSSNSQPAVPDVWGLRALVSTDIPGEILSATVSHDVPPPITNNMDESLPTLFQFGSTFYSDYSQFMLDYPATTYTIGIDRGVGPESGDVFLEEDLYCPEVPYLTGDTFDRLQSYDVSLSFAGTLNGFTLAPGTSEGSTFISVVQDNVGTVWSASLAPEETSFEIPAGLLLPATGYSIGITYLNWVRTDNAAFGTATSGAEFTRETGAVFTTLPLQPDPCTPTWTQANLVGRNYHTMAFDPNRGQVITFGGLDRGYRNDTWAWTGDVWRLAATTGPSERGFSAMVHHSGRNSVILAGGPSHPTDPADTWEWNGSAWTLLSTTGFSPRGYHAMAYDSVRDKIVMFGGAVYNGVDFTSLGDTWEWDGATWTEVATTGPAARNVHAMAYDPVRQRTVLFGGSEGSNFLDDTWEWDGTTWTQIPVTGPDARFLSTLVYDPTLQACVLYAGHNGSALNDVWLFDGATWTQVNDPAPTARQDHGMAFDEARGRMIVFGGDDQAGNTLADTWERNGTVWTDLTPAIPSRRSGGSMVYDSVRDRTIMFGGSFSPGVGSVCNSETWEWDGLSWSLRSTAGPSARALAPMVFDSVRARTVMVGGWCSTSVRDTWEWDGNTWSLRSTAGPSLRHFASIAFDAARGKTVLFGGYQPTPAEWKNDTWEWDGSTWTQLFIAGPPARYNAQMTYDAARQTIVLFGGNRESPSQLFGDTWEFNGIAWTQVSPGLPADPSPRVGHVMAYDSTRDRVTLYGGLKYSPTEYFGDTWEFDGATGTWTQVGAFGPPARASSGMAYDSAREQMVLFGGTLPLAPREQNDTWLFTAGIIISEQPVAAAVNTGQSVQFGVTAVGRGTLTYQWRKDGLHLIDGPSAGGGTISGATTSTLSITGVGAADAGNYDAIASGDCGAATSNAAALTVTNTCTADFNGDTVVDFFDYLDFVDAFSASDPAADFNGDSVIDFFDYLDFVDAFSTGC